MEIGKQCLAQQAALAIIEMPDIDNKKYEGLLDNCIHICDMIEAGMDEDGFEI